MALNLTTQQGSMPAGGSDDFEMAPPAGTPDVDSQSPDEIASLIRQANAGGTPPPVAPPAAPEPGKDPLDNLPPDPKVPEVKPKIDKTPEELKAEEKAAEKQANIFKKFGIPPELQSNEAIIKMAKGYGETETYASQNAQAKSQVEKLTQENEHLLNMAEDFQREANEARSRQASVKSDLSAPMTEEEIEEYNNNPKAAIAKAVQEALKPIQQKNANNQRQNEQDRVMDYKVLSEINKFKGDKKFAGLEKDVDQILKNDGLPYTPQSIALAFHAARSVRMTEIVNTAKNEAFTAGYNKHADEVKRQVDGGKSTVPAGGTGAFGGFTQEQVDDMSAADLAKLLPNSGK